MLAIHFNSKGFPVSSVVWKEEDRGDINDLPPKLSRLIIRVMEPLHNNNVRLLEYNPKVGIVLTSDEKKYSSNEIKDELKRAIELLAWYLTHRFERAPEGSSGTHRCLQCGVIQTPNEYDTCAFTGCTSHKHKNWTKVIDDYHSLREIAQHEAAEVMRPLYQSNVVGVEM